ncbi:MAG: DUF1489 family protein [Alphaproteobacteria bacterium]|nr:DUF1489 family protein [Alphaproteobacteria bacterium]
MTVHLVKLCVGAANVADLESWVKRRTAANAAAGLGRLHDHVTRMFPKRREELLSGGSIYWVIRGDIRVRQKIAGLEPVTGADGIERCAIMLEPPLVRVAPQPRKAFQGWRYLRHDDAPPDISGASEHTEAALRSELASLGLL